MDPRENSLPKWSQQLIADLRNRVKYAVEPMVTELARLRPQVERLKAHNEAMQDLLSCAARGGHKTAQEIIEVIERYDLVLREKGGA